MRGLDLKWSAVVVSPIFLVCIYLLVGQISFEVKLFCNFNHRLFCSECDEQSRMSSLMLSLLFLVLGMQTLGKLEIFQQTFLIFSFSFFFFFATECYGLCFAIRTFMQVNSFTKNCMSAFFTNPTVCEINPMDSKSF